MKKNLSKIGIFLETTAFSIALLCVWRNFPSFYLNVMAPTQGKQHFFSTMLMIGGAAAAIAALFFMILRKFWKPSPNKSIPVIIFASLTAVVPLVSPSSMSLIGDKVNWLTPTIVNNALTAAYVFYIVLMIAAGMSLAFVIEKLKASTENTGKFSISTAVCCALVLIISEVTTALPWHIGYDRVFYAVGISCAVVAFVGMIFQISGKKAEKN